VNIVNALLNTMRRTGATIVIGYCWLGLVWYIVESHVHATGRAATAIAIANRLSNAVGRPGALLVRTLAAYLIGLATVELLMPILRSLPLSRNTRTIVVQESDDDSANAFTTESTAAYVANGLMPARLYGQPTRTTYERLCAEARFLWAAPVPLIVVAVYLAATLSPAFVLAVPALLALMAGGWYRFRSACRLLSQESRATAIAEHERMVAEWDRRAGMLDAGQPVAIAEQRFRTSR
jgi:hypothetical protein